MIIVLALFKSSFHGQALTVFLSFLPSPNIKQAFFLPQIIDFISICSVVLDFFYFNKQMILYELCHCIYKEVHRNVEAFCFL